MGARWTADELDRLARLYLAHGMGWDGWDEALPGRSRNAIATMVGRLGARRHGRWTAREEAEALRGLVAISRRLGRPPDAVLAHMRTMRARHREAARAERVGRIQE